MSRLSFMDTSEERHAFLMGLFEALCPWNPKIPPGDPVPSTLKGERHYYLFGRALGFPTLILECMLLAKIIKEVLL